MAILCLIFRGSAIPFSTVAIPFYIPTDCVQWFQFLHILTDTYFLLFFFNSSHLNGCYWYLIVLYYVLDIMFQKLYVEKSEVYNSIIYSYRFCFCQLHGCSSNDYILIYLQSWRFSESPKDSKSLMLGLIHFWFILTCQDQNLWYLTEIGN